MTQINVTQDDIDKGSPRDCCSCPIAFAVSRVVRPDVPVSVGIYQLVIRDHEGTVHIRLPQIAEYFRREFDRDGKSAVSPIQFELDIPERFLREVA